MSGFGDILAAELAANISTTEREPVTLALADGQSVSCMATETRKGAALEIEGYYAEPEVSFVCARPSLTALPASGQRAVCGTDTYRVRSVATDSHGSVVTIVCEGIAK